MVTRISDKQKPQVDNNREYYGRPVRNKDIVVHNIYHSPVPCCIDSDESDDDEMSPLEAGWPEPEDEKWTVVERIHRGLRGTKGVDSNRFHNYGENLDNPGMGCDELDYFDKTNNLGIRSEVMPSIRREATQSDNPPTEVKRVMESATTSVKPAGCKRPNVIVVVPSMTTDRRVKCPVNVFFSPQMNVQNSLSAETKAEELFPEEPEVITAGMAEVASTGDMTDNQSLSVNQLNTMTTVTTLPTDYDEIQRPAPRRGLFEVAKEASTGDTTIEKCLYEVLDNNETTKRKLSTELLEYLSSQSREGFWNWPRKPGILVQKRSSLFLWRKFHHR